MADKTALSTLGKGAIALTALAAGKTIANGMKDTGTNVKRQQILMEQRKNDLSTPMYDPAVRLAELCKEASTQGEFNYSYPNPIWAKLKEKGTGVLQDAAAKALGNVMTMPVNYALGKAKDHFVTGPAHEKAFHGAIQSDPDLQRAFDEDPGLLHSSHATMKKFAPTVATDPNAVRSFLSHASATRGAIDFNTLKLLAETEKTHRGK